MHLPSSGDLIIDLVTVPTQILLGRFAFRRWKPRLSRPEFRLTIAILAALWTVVGFELILQTVLPGFDYRMPNPTRTSIYAVSTIWSCGCALSLAIYFGLRLLYRRLSPDFSENRRQLMKTAGALAVASPFVAIAIGAVAERTAFHVNEIDLPIRDLHPDLEGFRIVQVSDLHVSPFLSLREAARAIGLANETRAHLAVYTGDLISAPGDPLFGAVRELGRLRADAGVLGCLGNHEVFARCQDLETREAAKYGIHILRRQARQIRVGKGILNVAGVDYQPLYQKRRYLTNAEKLVVPGATNLLLSHNPDVFPVAVRKGFDSVLAGHTHGGQVQVEILHQSLSVARFMTPFVMGLYRLEGSSCYVTPGIGTIGMPVRLGARPEVSLFHLRRA